MVARRTVVVESADLRAMSGKRNGAAYAKMSMAFGGRRGTVVAESADLRTTNEKRNEAAGAETRMAFGERGGQLQQRVLTYAP